VTIGPRPRRASPPAGMAPLPPRKKWRAIIVATLCLIPGYWFMLNGLVSAAAGAGRNAGPLIAFGLAAVPFVFLVLAFLSEHPRAPGAVLRAMALAVLVGIPVYAVAGDAVTWVVAGIGAGGVAALRADLAHDWKPRALAVLAVSAFVFVLLRVAPTMAVLLAPALPFTAVGVADHLSERKRENVPESR
jgi:hypothetical protein